MKNAEKFQRLVKIELFSFGLLLRQITFQKLLITYNIHIIPSNMSRIVIKSQVEVFSHINVLFLFIIQQ